MKNIDTFLSELVIAVPEIADEVLDEDYSGLIGLQVGCLTRFTQKAMNDGDLKAVARSFKFIEDNIDKVEFAIENSLVISYLGKLNIPGNSSAERLLPTKLYNIRSQLNRE